MSTDSGYLVVADISGYTSYLARTELEHSQEVLAELLELIVRHVRPVLTILRLEGDAVFAHGPDAQVTRGETLLEVLEVTYVAFRDHVRGIVFRTTCECNACRAIPSLDLKFIVHHGDYVVQRIAGITELVGSEVNRLFRLTKNHVTEATGWNAYALFTSASLERIGLDPAGMQRQVETYEHLGEVTAYALNLHARYEEITNARHVVLSPGEAHGALEYTFGAPPPVVWEWLNDPRRRTQVAPEMKWSAVNRPGGRSGAGASNHCSHGKNGLTCENVLDWRPFDYVTTISTNGKLPDKLFDMTMTIMLEPIDDGARTHARWLVRLENLPRFAAGAVLKAFYKGYRDGFLVAMDQAMQAEYHPGEHEAIKLTGAESSDIVADEEAPE